MGIGIISFSIYVEEGGKPRFPILCFEPVSPEQMEAVRGKFASGDVLSAIESDENRGYIILWDESKRIANPPTSASFGNNESYSALSAVSYK